VLRRAGFQSRQVVANEPAAGGRGDHRGKHIIIRRYHRYPSPHGGRGIVTAGHSFRTGRPCSQPSRTHAPEGAVWQPGPQPSAAMAGPVIANMIKQLPRRAGRRIIVEAPMIFEINRESPQVVPWTRNVSRARNEQTSSDPVQPSSIACANMGTSRERFEYFFNQFRRLECERPER
jgi:hypothetical protein